MVDTRLMSPRAPAMDRRLATALVVVVPLGVYVYTYAAYVQLDSESANVDGPGTSVETLRESIVSAGCTESYGTCRPQVRIKESLKRRCLNLFGLVREKRSTQVTVVSQGGSGVRQLSRAYPPLDYSPNLHSIVFQV